MIEIQFIDKNRTEVNPGDWLKVSCRSFGSSFTTFYVQFELKEDYIIPHDTFSWNSIEKIAKSDIPETAVKATEGYLYDPADKDGNESNQHLYFIVGLGDINSRTKSYIIKEAK